MIRRGHKVPVQATYDWVRLMRRLHDEARLDVWDDRIIQAVLEALEDIVGEAVVEWVDSPQMVQYLLQRAGHEKAPVALESAVTGA